MKSHEIPLSSLCVDGEVGRRCQPLRDRPAREDVLGPSRTASHVALYVSWFCDEVQQIFQQIDEYGMLTLEFLMIEKS